MGYFLTIKDVDIFKNPLPEPKEYILRQTVKGIVIDNEGRVALLRGLTHSLLPGGGVEIGETNEQAFIRECKEEIGCTVEIVSTLGRAVNFRAKDVKKYEIVFFVGNVVGEKGKPTTLQEDEQGLPINWLSKEAAQELLERQVETLALDVYIPHFNCRTHLAAFKKFLGLNK